MKYQMSKDVTFRNLVVSSSCQFKAVVVVFDLQRAQGSCTKGFSQAKLALTRPTLGTLPFELLEYLEISHLEAWP